MSFFGVKTHQTNYYFIQKNVIYIKPHFFSSSGTGLFELVDDNTITYLGNCEFKKISQREFRNYKKAFTKSKANLRTEPNTTGDIIETVDTNEEIYLIKEHGDWYEVRANWSVGYMHKNLIIEKE